LKALNDCHNSKEFLYVEIDKLCSAHASSKLINYDALYKFAILSKEMANFKLEIIKNWRREKLLLIKVTLTN
jgi:hypothetical protein